MEFPVYISIGSWQIHPHLFFEFLAYPIAFSFLLKQKIRQQPMTPSQKSSIIVGGMVGALLGSKILVLLQHIYLTWQNWQLWFLLLIQGKTIVGAVLGGLIGVEFTKKYIGVKTSTGDSFVYPLIVGIAIGRIGCFLTGLRDKTYGIATNLPWGVDFGDGIYRHPTQLYEIIFILGLGIVLKIRSNYNRQPGDIFKFFMVAYLGFRLILDFLKPDFHILPGFSSIQIACIFGLAYYYRSIFEIFKFAKTK